MNGISLPLLRVVTAFVVLQHGAQTLFGMFGGAPAALFTLSWLRGIAEVLGGAALAVGFLTSPFALILAVDMGTFYVTQFLPDDFPPIVNRRGEVVCLLFSTTSLLAFTGPGRLSLEGGMPSRAGGPGSRVISTELLPAALGAIRILMGCLFLSYGLQKMFGMLGQVREPFMTLQWFAGVIELFGGTAIILGLFTRPVAFVCSGQMAFAYFINHNPRGFFPIENGGERAALFCFFFLFLASAGAGRWSVDRLRERAVRG